MREFVPSPAQEDRVKFTLVPSGKSLEVTVSYFYSKEIALSSKDALTMKAGCSLPAKGGYGIHPT
ncbi:MAG: hypothetical protein ACJAXD_001916 [Cryomorphaceae bacterium]|jgi:hypothetical protein